MTNEKTAQFLPFHAINEFMREDYRLEVVRSTLHALEILPPEARDPLNRLTRKLVQTPGFRNSAKAPASIRARPTAEAFTKSPQLAAAVLSAWAEAHLDLRQQVYDLLAERGWQMLPPDADRTRTPGFMMTWPKGEDFDSLNAAFKEKYPQIQANPNDVSLMVVWLSLRLPYSHEGEDTESQSEE